MSSGRPVATMFCVQLLFWFYLGVDGVPPAIAWTLSPLALGVCAVAALVELTLQHTADADEMLRTLYLDKVVSTVMTVPASLLLVSIPTVSEDLMSKAVNALVAEGLSEEDAAGLVNEVAAQGITALDEAEVAGQGFSIASHASDSDLVMALQTIAESDLSTGEQAAYLSVAVAINLVLVFVRGRVKEMIEDIGFAGIWAWLEGGGFLVAAVLIFLLPQLLLVLTILFSMVMVGIWLSKSLVLAVVDRARRRPCPHCEVMVRKEASVCKACGRVLEPSIVLGGGKLKIADSGVGVTVDVVAE